MNFYSDFGRMPPRDRPIRGFVSAMMTRRKLESLHRRNADAAQFEKNLTLIKGYKDQPDSDDVLVW